MCRFRLEDIRGSVGVTCFPRTYEENKLKIEDGNVVVVKAKLEEDAEEPAPLLDEVYTVEEAIQRFAGGIVIQIGPQESRSCRTCAKRSSASRELGLLPRGPGDGEDAPRARDRTSASRRHRSRVRARDRGFARGGRVRLARGLATATRPWSGSGCRDRRLRVHRRHRSVLNRPGGRRRVRLTPARQRRRGVAARSTPSVKRVPPPRRARRARRARIRARSPFRAPRRAEQVHRIPTKRARPRPAR